MGAAAGRRRLALLARIGSSPPAPALSVDRVAVVAALTTLPRSYRQAVVLHHLLGMPINEVAKQLRVPVGTVKARLARARTAQPGRGGMRGPPLQPAPPRHQVAVARRVTPPVGRRLSASQTPACPVPWRAACRVAPCQVGRGPARQAPSCQMIRDINQSIRDASWCLAVQSRVVCR
jgi:hypothetical protein